MGPLGTSWVAWGVPRPPEIGLKIQAFQTFRMSGRFENVGSLPLLALSASGHYFVKFRRFKFLRVLVFLGVCGFSFLKVSEFFACLTALVVDIKGFPVF